MEKQTTLSSSTSEPRISNPPTAACLCPFRRRCHCCRHNWCDWRNRRGRCNRCNRSDRCKRRDRWRHHNRSRCITGRNHASHTSGIGSGYFRALAKGMVRFRKGANCDGRKEPLSCKASRALPQWTSHFACLNYTRQSHAWHSRRHVLTRP